MSMRDVGVTWGREVSIPPEKIHATQPSADQDLSGWWTKLSPSRTISSVGSA
jgi:hypothetical protein